MDRNRPDPLVSTSWLAEHLDAPDVRIVDASWFMPGSDRDAKAEYATAHIPGAVFFDIDDIADTDSALPHMLPSPTKFAARVQKLGLGDGVRIVVYDSSGILGAARVWWTFRVMGHEDVVVLDGGLPRWLAEGRPVDDRVPVPRPRHFTPRLAGDLVCDLAQMRRTVETGRAQIIDARPTGRFSGATPEPRAGLRRVRARCSRDRLRRVAEEVADLRVASRDGCPCERVAERRPVDVDRPGRVLAGAKE